MKYITEHLFCSPELLKNIDEVQEIKECVNDIGWRPEFAISVKGKLYEHQKGYNKAFSLEFKKWEWTPNPRINQKPRLIGDFQKNKVFVEIQFGNSSTIYRDYYKFHFGLTHSKISLAVLIVPTKPSDFFPTRPDSVKNMAEFNFALTHFKLLPMPVPILLIGLLPEN